MGWIYPHLCLWCVVSVCLIFSYAQLPCPFYIHTILNYDYVIHITLYSFIRLIHSEPFVYGVKSKNGAYYLYSIFKRIHYFSHTFYVKISDDEDKIITRNTDSILSY